MQKSTMGPRLGWLSSTSTKLSGWAGSGGVLCSLRGWAGGGEAQLTCPAGEGEGRLG